MHRCSVCVWPAHVAIAAAELEGRDTRVRAAIGFPYGQDVPSVKRAACDAALAAGAHELAIMLETYRDDFVERLQRPGREERQRLTAQLAQAEHRYANAVELAHVLVVGLEPFAPNARTSAMPRIVSAPTPTTIGTRLLVGSSMGPVLMGVLAPAPPRTGSISRVFCAAEAPPWVGAC